MSKRFEMLDKRVIKYSKGALELSNYYDSFNDDGYRYHIVFSPSGNRLKGFNTLNEIEWYINDCKDEWEDGICLQR